MQSLCWNDVNIYDVNIYDVNIYDVNIYDVNIYDVNIYDVFSIFFPSLLSLTSVKLRYYDAVTSQNRCSEN